MKQPETESSDNKPNPASSNKKNAATDAVIGSRPVGGGDASPAKPEARQPVDSNLVGAGKGPDAAAPKPAKGESAPAKAGSDKVAPVRDATDKTPSSPKETPVKGAASSAAVPKSAATSSVPAVASGAAAASAAPAKSETRVVEVRKAGFMPTFLGGIVAAGLGAGATYWAIPQLPPAWQPGGAVEQPSDEAQLDAARTAATEAARAEVEAQVETLSSRAADAGADAARQILADSMPPASPAIDPEAIQTQQDKLDALERTVTELAARPAVPVTAGEGSEQLQAVFGELTARMAEQQRRIDELSSRPVADSGSAQQMQGFVAQAQALESQIAAAADAAQQRIAAAESQAAALQESAAAANRRAQVSAAAAALQAAISTGGARGQALADLQAAGVEPPAVLTGDLPTLAQLRTEFPAAAREGLAAALKASSADDGALGAIGNFLRVQTGARSVEPREGTDPDAVLSRADAAVRAGDVTGALTEIGTLPQPGQDAMAGWTAAARNWVDASAALSALAAGSM